MRAVVDPRRKIVVEGYGILQPRIGISIQSAASSRLAGLYSGQTGFDIYTRAVSDVYQDLFGEGIFTGKGIYDVDVMREVLEQRFPENALLSHDLIEGAYARVALVTDIELIDDYPVPLQRVQPAQAPLGPRRLADPAVDPIARPRLSRQPDLESDFPDFAVEDYRQSAAQPDRARDCSRCCWGLVHPAGSAGLLDRSPVSRCCFCRCISISCSPWCASRSGAAPSPPGWEKPSEFQPRPYHRAVRADLPAAPGAAFAGCDHAFRHARFVTKRRLLRMGDCG